jgi:hypothetical protein
MKKIYTLLGLLMILIVVISSCKKNSFLDKKTETLTEDKVFADSALTVSFLTDIYAYTGQDVIPERYNYINSTASGSNDDADLETLTTHATSYYSAPQASWVAGAYTASNSPFGNYWTTYYKKIRACSLFMQNVSNSPLSAAKKTRMAAEARFLRAFYYAGLIRYFGSVQLMGDKVLGTTDILISKRNTYKECVDYVLSELDLAAKDLPTALTQQATDYGRATQGACLALKARMLLTIASPLFNGSPIAANNPNIVYSTSYDVGLWQKASDAFKAVMDLNQYSLVIDNTTRPGHGFWKMFVKGRVNTEYIFSYQIANGHDLESNQFPVSRSGAGGYNNPSENAVQCFGMKNGKLITDPSSGYDAASPYLNRDPRFYYSIIYNQAPIFKSGSGTTLVPVNIYFDAATNALSQDMIQGNNNKTGYYSRKMCNDSTGTSVNIDRAYPVIRYAEIVLGYAEAQNELGNTETGVTYLNMIRSRGGVSAGTDGRYGVPAGISQSDLRKLIQNEYTVELFEEGHFFYDSRRWKTAEVTENQAVGAMYITKQTNGTFTYKVITALPTSWATRSYFAPVPQTEINKSATLLQNPGW